MGNTARGVGQHGTLCLFAGRPEGSDGELVFKRKLEGQSACAGAEGSYLTAVQQDGILDDGEAEPRPAHVATAALVDAIEALEDARQMLGGDADAVVPEDSPRDPSNFMIATA